MKSVVYNDIYAWDGWGGKLKLASGKCRLRIYDLRKEKRKGVAPFKPIIVVATDIPFKKQGPNQMTVKSCSGHLATCVTRDFRLNPNRMIWLEYYPGDPDSPGSVERFDEVNFEWKDGVAVQPRSRTPQPAVEALVKSLLDGESSENGDA